MATEEQHTRAKGSKLPSPGRARRPKTLTILEHDINRKIYERLVVQEELALDTETDGLEWYQDKLRIVQIATKQGNCFAIREPDLQSVWLAGLLCHPFTTKIFHHLLFDVRVIKRWMGVDIQGPMECTKILSKMVQPGKSSGLAALVKRTFGIVLPKMKEFNWNGKLDQHKKDYITGDVLYLHRLVTELKRQASHGLLLRYPLAIQAVRNKAILEVEGFEDVLDYKQAQGQDLQDTREEWARVLYASTLERAKGTVRIQGEKDE